MNLQCRYGLPVLSILPRDPAESGASAFGPLPVGLLHSAFRLCGLRLFPAQPSSVRGHGFLPFTIRCVRLLPPRRFASPPCPLAPSRSCRRGCRARPGKITGHAGTAPLDKGNLAQACRTARQGFALPREGLLLRPPFHTPLPLNCNRACAMLFSPRTPPVQSGHHTPPSHPSRAIAPSNSRRRSLPGNRAVVLPPSHPSVARLPSPAFPRTGPPSPNAPDTRASYRTGQRATTAPPAMTTRSPNCCRTASLWVGRKNTISSGRSMLCAGRAINC